MATKSGPNPGSLTAKWKKIAEHEVLKRSSHSVAAIGKGKTADGHELFVFGGELVARQPKDGDVHVFSASQNEPRSLNASPSSSSSTTTQSPTPRVGSTMAALQGTLYIFSGRGGPSMTALDEEGAFWTLTPSSKEAQWTFLSPRETSHHPEPRSYHSTTTDVSSQIYIHAGCAASGRLRDFWSFDINTKTWKQLPDAPGPARGGTSLCFALGKVWRFGGFDGEKEIGGVLDWYDVGKGEWGESVRFEADGVKGPGARSVAGLVPVVVGHREGKLYLVAVFGEADPSSLGHEGAGKMLGDVWAFDVEGQKWMKVDDSTAAGNDGKPAPRGWFGAAAVGMGQLAVVGGLGEDNERLGDAWVLEF
jgi:N-acetylneuraminic acid mutarotase